MSPLTLFLGRFFGLFCLLLCGVLFARPKASLDAIADTMRNPGLLLMTGIVTLAAGVATVIAHNIWTGGALTVAVTLFGWLMLSKGMALMAVPPHALGVFYRVVRTPAQFRAFMAVDLALSLWLTIAAFTA